MNGSCDAEATSSEGEGEGEVEGEGEGEGEGESMTPHSCGIDVPSGIVAGVEAVVSGSFSADAPPCFRTLSGALNSGLLIYVAPGGDTAPSLTVIGGIRIVGDRPTRGATTVITATGAPLNLESSVTLEGLRVRGADIALAAVAVLQGVAMDVIVRRSTLGDAATFGIVIDEPEFSGELDLDDVLIDGEIFVAFTGAGVFRMRNSSITDRPVQAIGTGGSVILENVDMSVSFNNVLRLGVTGANQTVRGSRFIPVGGVVGPNDCQGGLLAEQGTVIIRDSTWDSFPCPAIKAADNNALTLDLGTASDPGGNLFSNNAVDLLVDLDNNGSPVVVPAFGNTWSNAPPACGQDIVVCSPGDGVELEQDTGCATAAPICGP